MKSEYKLIRAIDLLQEAKRNFDEFSNNTGFRVNLRNFDEIELENVGRLNLDEVSEFASVHQEKGNFTADFIADFGTIKVNGKIAL